MNGETDWGPGWGGGGAVSPADFKKWQCPLSLFFKCPCRCLNAPISPVDFKKRQCPLTLFSKCSCRFKGSAMSPVNFNKRPCRPVEFKGQGPPDYFVCLQTKTNCGNNHNSKEVCYIIYCHTYHARDMLWCRIN